MRDDVTDRNKVLIFLHIPKTAGMTLSSIFERIYQPMEIYSTKWTGIDHNTIGDFLDIPNYRRQRIRLVMGHMRFGLHHYIPNCAGYITVLRNPADRIISHFHHVRRTLSHPDHNIIVSSGMTIEEYIQSGISVELNNLQTRLLAGVGTNVRFGECSSDLLQIAIDNLNNHFAVIGLTERFDETLLLMKALFKWKTLPYYLRKNVNDAHLPRYSVSEKAMLAIEKYNSLDSQLYRLFADKFNKSVIAEIEEETLHRFRFYNTIYGLPNLMLREPLRTMWKSIKPVIGKH